MKAPISNKNTEQANARKVLNRLAKMIKDIGFQRKRQSTWFARETEAVFQFIHIHKFSFACSFRIHLGVRIPNDNLDFISLNGPSVSGDFRISPYENIRSHEQAVEECASAMFDYINRDGESWFKSQTVQLLLKPYSCLDDDARNALRDAILGTPVEKNIRQSRALLGL